MGFLRELSVARADGPGARNEEARTNAGFRAGILALPQVSERV